jgi:hypothetical protein
MENYQSATVVVGIISTILWFIAAFAFSPIALIPGLIAFAFMFTCFADTKHCHTLGGIYIVVGILLNLLYLIPGIMALRWKPKLKEPVHYTPVTQNVTVETPTSEDRIKELEKRIAELEEKDIDTVNDNKELEDARKKLAEDQKRLDELEKKRKEG